VAKKKPPANKSVSLDLEKVAVSGDPKGTLNRWRAEALKEADKVSEAKPKEVGKWPDKESRWAEGRLRRKGIKLPWDYGDEFGDKDFKVIGLRAGGLGVVYFVESSRFNKKKLYAAKTLISFLKSDYLDLSPPVQEKISLSFLEEALPWLEMGQHPHIVPIHLLKNIVHPEFKRNIPFVFSEYMPRGNLEGYLKEKEKLTLKESLELGIQLCDGLLHAYDHDLEAHLDIKPENIMVYDDGLFKVTDFSANVIGTPGYMAPEQVVAAWRSEDVKLIPDEIQVDRKADQFAMGLVILEAYLGRKPFPICLSSCSDKDRAMRFVEEGVGKLADFSLPETLEEILNRVFSRKPNNRYPDLSDLRENLVKLYETKFGKYNVPEVEVDDSAEWWLDRGIAYQKLGRHALAEAPYKEALECFHRIPGTELDQARCTENLAIVYQQTGRFDEAECAYESSLKTFRRFPGTELEQAGCIENLATVYAGTGRFDDAERCFDVILKTYRQIPGAELQQAGCNVNLANVYLRTGRFDDAERAYESSLKTFRQITGTELEQAKCTENLANVYKNTGRFNDAERAYESSLKTYRRIPGTELNQAECTEGLANVYKNTGRFDDAEHAYESSLKTYRRIPGTELDQAKCTEGLAMVYQRTDRFDEAEHAHESSLKTYRRIPGTELNRARCTMNLAIVYRMTGRLDDAERYIDSNLKTYRSIPGTELPQADCTMQLASVYQQTGRFDDAERAYESSLEVYRHIPGTELEQAICIENLATVYRRTGRFDDAERAYKKSLETFRRISGTELEQATCMANLASCYQDSKNPSQAHQFAQEALKLCEPFPSEATAEIRGLCQRILVVLDNL
jgi:tetratricopeptide (TPR) repeat protein